MVEVVLLVVAVAVGLVVVMRMDVEPRDGPAPDAQPEHAVVDGVAPETGD